MSFSTKQENIVKLNVLDAKKSIRHNNKGVKVYEGERRVREGS